jgi:hypothetical protein
MGPKPGEARPHDEAGSEGPPRLGSAPPSFGVSSPPSFGASATWTVPPVTPDPPARDTVAVPAAVPAPDAALAPTAASSPEAALAPETAPSPDAAIAPALVPDVTAAVPEATAPALEPPPGGWYPASPGAPPDYSPAAGALAAPGRPGSGNGGTGGGNGTGSGGGGPRRGVRPGLPPPFTKRGPLVNVLLFGLAPVLLAGLVVAAFVLVAPGKPAAAAHTSQFKAGPAISAGQATASASPTSATTPSSAGRAKAHRSGGTRTGRRASMPAGIGPSGQASSHAATGTKSTKKKKHATRPATVTAHNLGAPNFAGYCQHVGLGAATVIADDAYGWHCTGNTALVIPVRQACAWTYGLDAAQVINVTTAFYDPNSWQCWRINGILGQLNVPSYCAAAGLGSATLKVGNAYGWYCDGQPVDFQAGCQFTYSNDVVVARFAVFADPYSWQCWH